MNKRIPYLTIILLLVLGLVRTAALASAPSPARASPETPNSSIAGQVMSEGGIPVSGATIQVSSGITATTDINGSYLIPDLIDGAYTLTPIYGTGSFAPPSLQINVPPDAVNQNFVYHYPKVFLPMTLKNSGETPVICQDFYDNFSDPTNGWHVGEDQDFRSEYLNGEYRVLIKSVDTSYLFVEPTCDRENYTVEVDARWQGNSGSSYGLFFGMIGNYDHFYSFDINTDYQEFGLWRAYPGGWAEIVPFTFSQAIHAGNATNHLKVTRNGTAITLEINGVNLGTWNDGNISGATISGLVIYSYTDLPNADARFDNFKVTTLGGSALVAGQDKSLKQSDSGVDSNAPDARILSLSGVSKATKDSAAQHDLSSLLSVQGTYCIPDGEGGCIVFVPPYPNFIGWSAPAAGTYFSLVDYAGLVDQWMEENCSSSLNTEISGSMVKRPEKDGRTRITVNLDTKNALAWVTDYAVGDFPGQMLFGHFAGEVCAGQEAALADSHLMIEYYVRAGQDPNLDLIRLTIEDPTALAEEGYELISLVFQANGSGPLREAYGVPDGTPGSLHITQTGTLNLTPYQGKGPADGFPAEVINLGVVGK